MIFQLPYGSFDIPDGVYDPVLQAVRQGKIWEGETLEFCEKLITPGSVVVDAGANIGTHTVRFSQLVGMGQVYAFEPQPPVFKLLQRNIELNGCNNVQALQVGLGREEGTAKMKIYGDFGSSRILAGGTEEIVVKPLDFYNLSNVSFIKVDVEAYEPYVFEGARQTIIRNRPAIIYEWGQVVYPEHPHDFVQRFLESLNYKCIRDFGEWHYCWVPAAL